MVCLASSSLVTSLLGNSQVWSHYSYVVLDVCMHLRPGQHILALPHHSMSRKGVLSLQIRKVEGAQSLDFAHNLVADRPQTFGEVVDRGFASGRSSHSRSGCAGSVRKARRRCLRNGRGRHSQPQKGKRKELHGEQLDSSRWLSSSTS